MTRSKANVPKAKLRQRPFRKSARLLKDLSRYESPDTTFLPQIIESNARPEGSPVVMGRAKGSIVHDVDGNRYVDLTACFGVLAFGHRSPVTLRTMRRQGARLIHGMGDVHPSDAKIQLLRELGQMTPFENPRIILGQSGSDAIEAAMKTALLVTGRHHFVVFSGSYHGLGLGSLQLTSRPHFKMGFESWSSEHVSVLPFPLNQDPKLVSGVPLTQAELEKPPEGELSCASVKTCLDSFLKILQQKDVAAIVLEPIQGRAGERTFPENFVHQIAKLARDHGALVIADECFTGFGRTGPLFGVELHNLKPDLLCVGKTLGGGLPLSACIGDVVAGWPRSEGEARHTQTFLGHPLACALGAATLKHLKRERPSLLAHLTNIDSLFETFLDQERALKRPDRLSFELRGRGWMRGFWFFRAPPGFAVRLSDQLLSKGFMTLPSGPDGRVLSLTPPLNISIAHLRSFLQTLSQLLNEHGLS